MKELLIWEDPLRRSYVVSYKDDKTIQLLKECYSIKDLGNFIATLHEIEIVYDRIIFDTYKETYEMYFRSGNTVRVNDIMSGEELKEYRNSRFTLLGYYQYKYRLDIIGSVYYADRR